jgi:hypothetical protein
MLNVLFIGVSLETWLIYNHMALSWRFSMKIRLVKETFFTCSRQAIDILIKYCVLVSIGYDNFAYY